MLIGTLSGWPGQVGELRQQPGLVVDRSRPCRRCRRSRHECPASRTCASVSSRSCVGPGRDDVAVDTRARCRGCDCSNRAPHPLQPSSPARRLSMPSVTQVSSPSARTPSTIAQTCIDLVIASGCARRRPCRTAWAPPVAVPHARIREHRRRAASACSAGNRCPCDAHDLRTIGAVLGAAAGLDRQQRRDLHLGWDRTARDAPSGRG